MAEFAPTPEPRLRRKKAQKAQKRKRHLASNGLDRALRPSAPFALFLRPTTGSENSRSQVENRIRFRSRPPHFSAVFEIFAVNHPPFFRTRSHGFSAPFALPRFRDYSASVLSVFSVANQ